MSRTTAFFRETQYSPRRLGQALSLTAAALLFVGPDLSAQKIKDRSSGPPLPSASTGIPPAESAAGEVLILDVNTDGGNGVTVLAGHFTAAGKTPVIVDAATWLTLTTADFAEYDAIALPDPTCATAGGGDDSPIAAAIASAAVWGPAIDGNVLVIGTDEVFHQFQGGDSFMAVATDFVVADAAKTGAYISLSCYYHDVAPNFPLPWLGVAFGGTWSASGVGCFNDAHIVATHPALAGLTDAILSNWSCSVHEGIASWPINFEVLAIAENAFGGDFVAPDGTVGFPYILARGVEVISDILLSPDVAVNPVGTDHTVTALVTTDNPVPGTPIVGTTVTFTVIAGPHVGTTDTDDTDVNGEATFTYTGTIPGIDTIEATFIDDEGNTQRSNRVTKEWLLVPCFTLDFETDDQGNAMPHGAKVDTEFDGGVNYPVTITGVTNDSGDNTVAILNSSTGPAAQDPDLLVGSGNILILQTDTNQSECPPGSGVYCTHNDDEDGGRINFDFNDPSTPGSIDLIDNDATDQNWRVVLVDGSGDQRIYVVPAGWTGDLVTDGPPGMGTLDLTILAPQPGFASIATAVEDAGFDANDVVRIFVEIEGSGGLDNLTWCP